jgi:trimeric autotransporter adhesin
MKLLPGLGVFTCLVVQCGSAQDLICSPGLATVPPVGVQLVLEGGSGSHRKFKYDHTNGPYGPITSPFIVLPASGTTPLAVSVGLNPSVVAQYQPGESSYLLIAFTTVDQTPPVGAACRVLLTVPSEPAPSIQSVVNAASLQPLLSPGSFVSILGSHLTGPTLSTDYDATASYPTSVAGTSVTFNGIAAPLLYLSPGQINALVPFALAGQKSAQVVVQRFQMVSAAFTLALQDTSPGIFTATQSGSGQGAILQKGSNGLYTYNGSDNPAASGTALEIFATGAGVWTPPAQSDVFLFGSAFTTQPVSVTIGGQAAKLLYAGTLGTQSTWSLLQVNAVVPDGVAPGPQRVVLKIGANDNSPQKVTVWVK